MCNPVTTDFEVFDKAPREQDLGDFGVSTFLNATAQSPARRQAGLAEGPLSGTSPALRNGRHGREPDLIASHPGVLCGQSH